jgi:hypothetical protein
MDPTSLISGLLAAQTARIQLAAAAKLMQTNSQSASDVAMLVAAAQQNADSLANVAAGLGGNLNVTA